MTDIRERMRRKAMFLYHEMQFVTVLVMLLALYVWALLVVLKPKCEIQHLYKEGDSVMVADVRDPITVVTLVCRNGHWEVLP